MLVRARRVVPQESLLHLCKYSGINCVSTFTNYQ
jgi:hypothetical protein